MVSATSGDYDEAVQAAARVVESILGRLLIQDTAWPGYQQTPKWIVNCNATKFREIDDQFAGAGGTPPDLVVAPVGVGSLAQAAVAHYRHGPSATTTVVLGVQRTGRLPGQP